MGGRSVEPNVPRGPQPTLVRPVIGVVDDDPSVLKALGRLLRSAGFDVVAFSSAEEFLARFQQQALGCLVLDIHLEGMSGLDLQAYLADARIPLPIVFITAHDDPVTRERAHQSRQVYLRKPVDDDTLLGAIASVLA